MNTLARRAEDEGWRYLVYDTAGKVIATVKVWIACDRSTSARIWSSASGEIPTKYTTYGRTA